ncbi:CHAT domain-containing protein [Candidatus Entotheonella palauensis]|uniref:CHAT domain-containing protein n=1 Tax=Candidatus Entotheonella palauensis TaxID=93172 RepID=UPI0015C48304|nr:CHAT domain-containing protein [Candidatus Entotheonella palauensis]
MASEPIELTIQRQEHLVVMDLVEVDPVVPRGEIRVETDLLTKVGEELARITALASSRTTLSDTGMPIPMSQLENMLPALRQLGRFIYEHLFPTLIRQRLSSAPFTDLFLHLDEQLVHVPWELAFDGQDFLLTRFRVGRQAGAHRWPLSEEPVSPKRLGFLKMLIIADPTDQLPSAREEAEHLSDLLAPCTNLDVSLVKGQQLRKPDLLQVLPEYDLVHYAGQARFDAVMPSRSGWMFQDDVLTTAEFSRMNALPCLVFSNVCQSGRSAPRQKSMAYNGQAFGMGHAFLLAGLQNYLGTFCATHDTSSAEFAAEFYHHFLQGESIGSALAFARQRSRQQAEQHGLRWASYLHYGNPSFRIVSQPDPGVPTRASEPVIEDLLREINEREELLQRNFAREVTIFFTDIKGSTNYYEQYGDVSGRLMVQRHNDLLFPLITAHQGTLLRTIGDAILAIFDEPVHAVEAAIDMQRVLRDANQGQEEIKQIRIRIGINSGQALIESHDVYGDAVNVAARVEGHALPEQILISESTYQRLPDTIPCRSLGTVPFKGKALPAELYEVLWDESQLQA